MISLKEAEYTFDLFFFLIILKLFKSYAHNTRYFGELSITFTIFGLQFL